jgi:hypothetical protein
MGISENAGVQRCQSVRGLAALLAAEFVDRCGDAAIGALVERRHIALEQGDDFGAEGWRHVLIAAEDILASISRGSSS